LSILGASGGVGKWLTRLAAERGHDVRVVVRSEAPFEPPPELTALRGGWMLSTLESTPHFRERMVLLGS
jgi:uncharacterized protein YbjT (DUF2867 family)